MKGTNQWILQFLKKQNCFCGDSDHYQGKIHLRALRLWSLSSLRKPQSKVFSEYLGTTANWGSSVPIHLCWKYVSSSLLVFYRFSCQPSSFLTVLQKRMGSHKSSLVSCHAIFEKKYIYCVHPPFIVLATSSGKCSYQERHFDFCLCMNKIKPLNKGEGKTIWFSDVYFFQCMDYDNGQLFSSFGKWDPCSPGQVSHCW